ncbi:EF-hand domain-containing protein [Methylocystis sp.]|jgi:Ca2+-binding EF-hand superfamily protein|uniref:EF-hand domain-containing protein n=1 Tax=Methylocystis sp. TaxID=1911079 RepID=UPI003D12125E
MNKALLLGALALAGVMAPPATSALAKATGPAAALDADNNGMIDLNEVNNHATELFTRLDKDSDGTVDLKEMKGRVSKKEFEAADPDNDGTLSKDEFLIMISGMFKDADPDNDGALDADEIASKNGKALLRVMR